MRSYMCQHWAWRSQLYAGLNTSLGDGQYDIVLYQLRSAYEQRSSQPESNLHHNTILDNWNILQPKQFDLRRVRSSILEREGINQSPAPSFFLRNPKSDM